MRTLRFAYDVQCPYAYLASKRVRALANASGYQLEYHPVLLGGLYADSKAPQGKDGSASDVMAPAKARYNARDLEREAKRWGVTLVWNTKHPIRSVKAMRVLAAIGNQEIRGRATDALYDAYWKFNLDIAIDDVLVNVLKGIVSKDDILTAFEDKDTLKHNTTWASTRGVFGVPDFWIMDENGKESSRFWYGQDRTFLVGRALGLPVTHPLANPWRVYPTSGAGSVSSSPSPNSNNKRLELFHDFSSPWSYLGSSQVQRIAKNHGAQVMLRPILLGAVFKEIGTPNVPMFAMSDAKRDYMSRDMEDWKAFWGGITLNFPSTFPIRTVVPLRVAILEPRTTPHIYEAAWVKGLDIGNEQVLADVLTKAGFDGPAFVKRGTTDMVLKEALIANTKEAVQRGLCGVPSFSVNGGELIWGQDRYNVVEDMLVSGLNNGGGGGVAGL